MQDQAWQITISPTPVFFAYILVQRTVLALQASVSFHAGYVLLIAHSNHQLVPDTLKVMVDQMVLFHNMPEI
jgi:hypothetical protein